MFDISFAELMMVAIVGLLVIGPEKLPNVARTLGAYTGRLQRYISQVKEEVSREVRFEELQALQQEIKAGADQVKSSIRDGNQSVKETLNALDDDIKPKQQLGAQKPMAEKVKAPVKKAKLKKAMVKKPAIKKVAVSKASSRATAPKKKSVKQTTDKAQG